MVSSTSNQYTDTQQNKFAGLSTALIQNETFSLGLGLSSTQYFNYPGLKKYYPAFGQKHRETALQHATVEITNWTGIQIGIANDPPNVKLGEDYV